MAHIKKLTVSVLRDCHRIHPDRSPVVMAELVLEVLRRILLLHSKKTCKREVESAELVSAFYIVCRKEREREQRKVTS